ncbi:hypothetical protein CDL12_13332 [Handroanthus impetiginosus]|uniref:Uncharacterized protein n=1 Tax=Handroanthus impetiginosus TaxID=429701 RepID=A0A2G9H994_9LAMI|nr:hypothetical protein CDL12_23670 [Handroanthus impetiginosus]PIN14043.1 hypothetical protein CDL12_13332 [Handroanthus impetiginosus]
MSKRVTSSVHNGTAKSRQPVQSYQPVWMAHWMRSSSTAAAERRDQSARGSEELEKVSRDESLTNGLEASTSVKEQGMIETNTFEVVNESLRLSSESLEKEEMCSYLVKQGEDADNKQAIRPIFGHSLERGKAIGSIGQTQLPSEFPTVNETSLARFPSLGEGTSKNPLEWMKTHSPANDRSFEMLKPFQGTFVGSSTHIVPYYDPGKYEFDKGKAAVSSLISRSFAVPNNQLPNADLRMTGQEHSHNHIQSADLICARKMDIHSESDASLNASFRECNTSLLFDAPSTSGHHMPISSQDWFENMQKYPRITLIPRQCIASEETESKKSHYDCYFLQKLPNSVHDPETMKICTTMDSEEATPGGCPRFSQTTHSLLITKKTDVSLPEKNDIFRTTRLITEVNRNTSSDLHSLSPFFGQGNRGVKLQPLSSSSNSEGKQNVGDAKSSKVTIKNESSAETDTMDMDFLKGNPNSGANSTPSTKGFNIDSSLSPKTALREVGRRRVNTGLPDINLELPALPAIASSSENARPSSSKTQSLEMDMLLAHAEQPKRKSNLCPDDSSEANPTSRWVKRLKPSSSNSFAKGAKISNLAENSSHDKTRKFFRSILETSINNTEPTPRKHHGKETILSEKNEDSTVDPAKNGKESLLAHTWIKRWLRNGSRITQKKPQMVVTCEPQSLKLDDLQKKQFPSIGAMALMGKAMNGFQSCELQKRGSFTIWNTKAF